MNSFARLAGIAALGIFSASCAAAAVVNGQVTAFPDGNINNAHFFNIDTSDFANAPGKRNNNNRVGDDHFDRPHLYAFDEVQNHTLAADLTIDGGVLTAGTVISSHFVFFDPENTRRQEGWVSFDAEIIGLITSTGGLDASDGALGALGVDYRTPSLRGLESGDSAFVDAGDDQLLRVDWRASDPGDYMRVITASAAAIPVPAALPLLLSGLAGFGWIGRRRRRG